MSSSLKEPGRKGEKKPVRTLAVGWLIDGKGSPALRNSIMEIAGGDILAIHRECGPAELARADVDLSSSTLLPGLCDGHVHLSLSGTEDGDSRKRQLSASFQEARETIANNLKDHLAHGIAAVRHGGDREGHALQFKRNCLDSDSPVQVFAAGHAWHAPGRYGAMIGRTPLKEKGLTDSIRYHERGDLIKIINSGPNSLSVFGKETPPQFSLEDLRKAAVCGHSMGLKLMVHANGRLPVKWALEAGCDSIEHGYFMGKENLERMAEKRIPWIPTVFAMKSLCTVMRGAPEAETAERNVEHQLEQIRFAAQCGVVVALGTDSGSVGVHHGKGVIEELQLLMTAGMRLEEAVQCATSRVAGLLGLGNLGSLDAGNRAFFVVAQGDPGQLPGSLNSPEAVFVDGVPVIYHDK